MSDVLRQMQGAGTIGPVPVVHSGPSVESRLVARLGLPADTTNLGEILERADAAIEGFSNQMRTARERQEQFLRLTAELDLAHAELERAQASDRMVDEGSPANETDPQGPANAELVARLRAELFGAQGYINELVREGVASGDRLKELARAVQKQVHGVKPVWVRGDHGNEAGYNVFLPVGLADTLLAALHENPLPVDPPTNPV